MTSTMAESGSMHIICPHCSTSYAINSATLGATGRTVRCSRCKEVWLARAEDAVEPAALQPAMAEAGGWHEDQLAAQWGAGDHHGSGNHAPVVNSPSIAGDGQAEGAADEDRT